MINFKKGEKVIVYQTGLQYKYADIVEKIDNINAYKIHIDNDPEMSIRIFGFHNIFALNEKSKLLSEIRQDQYNIEKIADELESELEQTYEMSKNV